MRWCSIWPWSGLSGHCLVMLVSCVTALHFSALIMWRLFILVREAVEDELEVKRFIQCLMQHELQMSHQCHHFTVRVRGHGANRGFGTSLSLCPLLFKASESKCYVMKILRIQDKEINSRGVKVISDGMLTSRGLISLSSEKHWCF